MEQAKKLRTNSKEVKEKIQAYIISCIDTEQFPEHDGTLWKSLFLVANELQINAFTKYELKQNGTYQKAFIYYLMGLPSYFSIEVYNSEVIKLMESFGLPLPANKDISDGVELFNNLIYINFCDLCKKNGLVFPIYNYSN